MTTEATEIPEQVEETKELLSLEELQAECPEAGGILLTREQLEHQVKYLARCRQDADKSQAAVRKTEAQIVLLIKASLLGEKLEELNDMLRHDRELLARQDTNVRTLAIEIFNAEGTGDKRPHPAIGINMLTRVDYDLEEALTYAREHYPGAVKLDKRAFDKIAKATPHKFVTISKIPSTKITRDLSAYLLEEDDDTTAADKQE